MEQKRFLIFVVTTVAILMGWQAFVMPRFMPPKPAPVVQRDAQPEGQAARKPALADKAQKPEAVAEKPGAEKPGAEKPGAEKPGAEKAIADKPAEGAAPGEELSELKKHPHRMVALGSLQSDSAFRMLVTLDSRGAAISQIELNDPRYRDLQNRQQPLKVIGSTRTAVETLQTAIPALDLQLRKYGLTGNSLDWEIVPGSQSESAVTFRLISPDGKLEVLKRFELPKVDPAAARPEAPAYDLRFALTVKNLGDEPRTVQYELQGPVGMPLENADFARKFRDVAVGFVTDKGGVKAQIVTAKEVAQQAQDGKIEEWKSPIRYIGVDVQYFAALLLPKPAPDQAPFVSSSKAVLVGPNHKERSEVSIHLASADLDLPAATAQDPAPAVTHEYELFAGPKRESLLPEGASSIIDYGFSRNLYIPQAMLGLLDFFHNLFPSWAWPYGWAIIMLTVVVRMLLFPLSRKQAMSAVKMQAIQPEIAALKKKYGSDTEKLGRAQMELFRKHNYSPFGGCLPMIVQLPIMIGLYQALNVSVDLRQADFLWVKNLAAPDALFRFPFSLPFLGWDFNLLPIITIGLFILQQKMFTPPALDKEQEMQQKMMSFMMIFMGFMFYNVPAGLCVYFIASSLWGLAERKLLPKAKPAGATGGDGPEGPGGESGGNNGGFFSKATPAPPDWKSIGKKKSRNRR
jgi:YidC/Oxa1 family membrane protein insertase